MKHHHLPLFALLLMAATSSLSSQVIDRTSAERLAAEFLGVNAVELAHLEGTDELPLVYIFNASDGEGSVEIAGDVRALRPVLGYSRTGHIDWDSVNDNFKAVIADLAMGMEKLLASSDMQERVAQARARRSVRRVGEPEEVAPLMSCAWDQQWPFNNFAPIKDGMHSMTGCVATAIAQVMYYYKWPARGIGQVSYQWNGQTLSADLSQSVYRWDLMLDAYEDPDNCPQESADAVALLLRDVGYAMKMDYSPYGSGAFVDCISLIENFDYDADMKQIRFEQASIEGYIEILRAELLAGRPVLAGGQGHQYVIDGFDSNGYYHYNLGWGPGSDVYLLVDGTGYTSAELNYNIKPNEGGTGDLSYLTTGDLKWTGEGDWVTAGAMAFSCCAGVTAETTIAVENMATGEVWYMPEKSVFLPPNYCAIVDDYEISMPLPDGTYSIYPLARREGETEWHRFTYSADKYGSLMLTVKDGKKTYEQHDYIVGGIRYRLSPVVHEAHVIGYTNPTEVVILDDIVVDGESWPVTTIVEHALACSEATSIVIGNNVRHIGMYAFGASPNLVSITVPLTVEDIESDAFLDCPKLPNVDGLIYSDSYLIGVSNKEQTFYPIRPGTTKIASNVFVGCPNVTSVVVPEGVTTIYASAFEACWNLDSVTIPYTVTYIGEKAFNNCQKITTLYWDSDLSPWKVCRYCDSSLAEIHFGEHVTCLPKESLMRMHVLKTLTFSEGLRSIDDYAIYNCDALTTIDFPSTLESIGTYAFYECTGLTSVVLPEKFRSLGRGAFRNCFNLTSVDLGKNLKEIGPEAFNDCYALSTITLPEGLISIGDEAFICCALPSIVIPSSVTSLGCEVFYGCDALRDVWILSPEPPAYDFSFLGAHNLESINVLDTAAFAAAFNLSSDVVRPMITFAQPPVYSGTLPTLTPLSNYPGMTCSLANSAIHTGTHHDPLTIAYDYDGQSYSRTFDFAYTIAPAPLTLTIQPAERPYGAANPAFTFTAEGFVGDEDATVLNPQPTFFCEADEWSNVGYYPVSLVDTISGDYKLSAADGMLTITKAPLTIIAHDMSRLYGDPNPWFTYDVEGYVNGEGDWVLRNQPYSYIQADELSDVGTYPIEFRGATALNYAISYIPGTLTVNKRPAVINVINASRCYGEENPIFAFYTDGYIAGEGDYVLTTRPTITTPADRYSDTGDYLLEASGAEATNYEFSYVPGLLSVSKRELNLYADAVIRPYGEENPAFTYYGIGYVNDDTDDVITVQPTFSTDANPCSDVGDYTIDMWGAEARNYYINCYPGQLTIVQAMQDIVWEQEFGDELYVGSSVMLDAWSTSHLPVSYICDNSSAVLLRQDGDTWWFDCQMEGSFNLIAIQEGNHNYLPATRLSKPFTILPTGIHPTPDASEPQMIYDLSGRRVLDTDGLKGLYIVNGRKVLFK